MSTPLGPRRPGSHSQPHRVNSRPQEQHNSRVKVDPKAKSRIPRSDSGENSVEEPCLPLSDREIEERILDAMIEIRPSAGRNMSESEKSDTSSGYGSESDIADALQEAIDDVPYTPDRQESDSGVSGNGDTSETESLNGWQDLTAEKTDLQSGDYLKHQKQNIHRMMSNLADLKGDSEEQCHEFRHGVMEYLQALTAAEKPELVRGEIMALRSQIKQRLPSIEDRHKGWLFNTVNRNREALEEAAFALSLEVFRTLPAELRDRNYISDEDATPDKVIAGLLQMGGLAQPHMFVSASDYRSFQAMCEEEAMEQLMASKPATKVFEQVVGRLGREKANNAVPALVALAGVLPEELFASTHNYVQAQKLCRTMALDKITDPKETIRGLTVSDDLLAAIDEDDQLRHWGKFLQDMRDEHSVSGDVVMCKQCEVDLVRQRMVLKKLGQPVVDNEQARANPESDVEKAKLTAGLETYLDELPADQAMQMLSVLNQTLFNSMSSIAEIAVREKMGAWGHMGIVRDQCHHGIDVDKAEDGTVTMTLTLEARPQILADLAPDKVIVYSGRSKVRMVRQITLRPGQDMAISPPDISLTLEKGEVKS